MNGGGAANHALIDAVRRELAASHPTKAGPMQAYMKSAMPYCARAISRAEAGVSAVLDLHPLPDRAAWEATGRALWREAGFREER